MAEIASTSTPHTSKEDFIANGLEAYQHDHELECSICREPIAPPLAALQNYQVRYQSPFNGQLSKDNIHKDTQISDRVVDLSSAGYAIDVTQPMHTDREQQAHYRAEDESPSPLRSPYHQSQESPPLTPQYVPEPEPAVRIRFCSHIFGRTCLLTWLKTGNRCPECNQTLYAHRTRHIRLQNPTPIMRLDFATFVEEMMGDVQYANVIRGNLMSNWTRNLMREVVICAYTTAGYEVTWEYADEGGENEGEAEGEEEGYEEEEGEEDEDEEDDEEEEDDDEEEEEDDDEEEEEDDDEEEEEDDDEEEEDEDEGEPMDWDEDDTDSEIELDVIRPPSTRPT